MSNYNQDKRNKFAQMSKRSDELKKKSDSKLLIKQTYSQSHNGNFNIDPKKRQTFAQMSKRSEELKKKSDTELVRNINNSTTKIIQSHSNSNNGYYNTDNKKREIFANMNKRSEQLTNQQLKKTTQSKMPSSHSSKQAANLSATSKKNNAAKVFTSTNRRNKASKPANSSLGKILSKGGQFVGDVLSLPFTLGGEIFNSDTLRNIGKGASQATSKSGGNVGDAAAGAFDMVIGAINGNETKKNRGSELLTDTAKSVGNGIKNTVKRSIHNTEQIVDGYLLDDREKIKAGTKGLLTTTAIGAVSLSVLGYAVDLDTEEIGESSDHEHVDSHEVNGYTRADGTEVASYFRDGDGDPNTNSTEGYYRHK